MILVIKIYFAVLEKFMFKVNIAQVFCLRQKKNIYNITHICDIHVAELKTNELTLINSVES